MANKLRITLTGSLIGGTQRQRECVKSLGLRKRHQSRVLEDTPIYRGMINQVLHLLQVEEVQK